MELKLFWQNGRAFLAPCGESHLLRLPKTCRQRLEKEKTGSGRSNRLMLDPPLSGVTGSRCRRRCARLLPLGVIE